VSCALPGGAFYVFPNVGRYLGRKAATTLELAARLLDEEKVAVVPGEGFGAPGYLRISFARAMSDLQEGARRLQAFMGRLGSD
jgi:aspartate/methionine/tyrosine aminotransferase